MPGAVALEDRTSQVLELLRRLLEVDELRRRERDAVLVRHLDVVVARQRPEALAVADRLFLPVQGVFGPQGVEHPPRLIGHECVEVGQVDVLEGDGCGGRHGCSSAATGSG